MAKEGADADATHEANWRYDVYISFKGEDTRLTFVSHLYHALLSNGVTAVIDNDDLMRGDTIALSLFKAIEDSRIAIVVLSENFPSSTYCLNELVKILECNKMKNQLVCPIFYHVDPSDVRRKKGSCGEAMAEHESRFGKDSEKVQKWSSALIEIANLSGFDCRNRDENQLIHETVKFVIASLPSLPSYNVYLSFRGEDTRLTFVSHLYHALFSNGVTAFKDDDVLMRGDTIALSLIKAIEDSRIAIVVLSENFASSSFCLEELVKILECNKMKNQLVCPIFYNVDQDDVRHQRGSYGEAMAHHESKFGTDFKKVQKWRSALTEIANLSGFEFDCRDQNENELIQRTVKWVIESLPRLPRYDVYLRFIGQDTPLTFGGDLYDALLSKGFRTFINDGNLKSGDQIEFSLIKAIEDSRIAIVVLSENFASSGFCLHELVKILECKNMGNQLVYPIFYNVDPSHVRHQKGSYGEAMARHEWRFGSDSEEVEKWRSALSEVADLSGWHFQPGDQYGDTFIQRIVKWVTESLPCLPRYDVFLSFSGVDIHNSFTGHLYNALRQAGLLTFMNNKALEGEDQISSSLIDAIEQSRLSIIVFSKNYGYSSYCLDQLVKILECMEMKNQLVWPIFYKVESLDLRHQRNSYDMAAHENRLGKDSKKVRKWRSALSEVAYLRGWHFNTGYVVCFQLLLAKFHNKCLVYYY